MKLTTWSVGRPVTDTTVPETVQPPAAALFPPCLPPATAVAGSATTARTAAAIAIVFVDTFGLLVRGAVLDHRQRRSSRVASFEGHSQFGGRAGSLPREERPSGRRVAPLPDLDRRSHALLCVPVDGTEEAVRAFPLEEDGDRLRVARVDRPRRPVQGRAVDHESVRFLAVVRPLDAVVGRSLDPRPTRADLVLRLVDVDRLQDPDALDAHRLVVVGPATAPEDEHGRPGDEEDLEVAHHRAAAHYPVSTVHGRLGRRRMTDHEGEPARRPALLIPMSRDQFLIENVSTVQALSLFWLLASPEYVTCQYQVPSPDAV